MFRAPAILLFLLTLPAYGQPCLNSYTFTQQPAPIAGTYCCGDTVSFCFTVTGWNTTSANWLHGVGISWGAGWDPLSVVPGAFPLDCDSVGVWGWYSVVQGTSNTNIGPQGPGFFFDFAMDEDGDPGNNFGDHLSSCDTNGRIFCWTMRVRDAAQCTGGADLSVTVNTFSDSETGSWGSMGCTTDAIVSGESAVVAVCSTSLGREPERAERAGAYPTLFSDRFNVVLPAGTWGDILLIDALGREARRIPSHGNSTLSIERGELRPGAYRIVLVHEQRPGVRSLSTVFAE